VLAEHELFLFAGVFFLIGAIDELLVDGIYGWLCLSGRLRRPRVDRGMLRRSELAGLAAMFVPAWQEAAVIGPTIGHALRAWPQRALRIYVGVYRNDPATLEAVMRASGGDPRVRVVINDRGIM